MNKLVNPLSRALFDSDLIVSRLTLALSELFWAMMLAWPGDTFGRPTYTGMAYIMSEEWWALLFIISATIQISIVIKDNLHGRCARAFAGWNAALWLFVVTSMLASVYPPPAAISAEIAVTFSACWIWIRPMLLTKWTERAKQ